MTPASVPTRAQRAKLPLLRRLVVAVPQSDWGTIGGITTQEVDAVLLAVLCSSEDYRAVLADAADIPLLICQSVASR